LPEIRKWKDWDKGWREGLQRLPPSDQLLINNSLLELLRRLAVCSHALEDSSLASWRPTRWGVQRVQRSQGIWVEYRLGDRDNRARVIVCHMVAAEVVYLVARTAIHDHEGLNKVVSGFQP
jgi:hypothetical protein